ncbi:ribonuclease H1-like [Mya arenaria]|uniref:ribonuclease H1-like n=1 Tax=Mya arenaria TaxID=6604 RepID=UPI0022E01192|nr:ribonuclease H1-like [Mya arenaria]
MNFVNGHDKPVQPSNYTQASSSSSFGSGNNSAIQQASGHDSWDDDDDDDYNGQIFSGGVNKAPRKRYSSHIASPYQPRGSSASWRQTRVTQRLDDVPMRHSHSSSNSDYAEVYTDGACSNNGFGNPQAGIGVYWGPNHPQNVSEKLRGRQTNNRAEIHAVVKAVEQASGRGVKDLTVNTDSQFLINSMTKWVKGWQRNGWKKSSGEDVINKEDFEALIKASNGINIKWNHVRGHQGIEGNEQADRLAREGTTKS